MPPARAVQSPALIALTLRAARWLEAGMIARLADAGWPHITRTQTLVFAHLDRGGTRPSELARRMGVTRQAAHETVQQLLEVRLVELTPDAASQRARLVVPTTRGKRLIAEVRAISRELEGTLERRIGRKRLGRLRRALEMDWGAPVGEG